MDYKLIILTVFFCIVTSAKVFRVNGGIIDNTKKSIALDAAIISIGKEADESLVPLQRPRRQPQVEIHRVIKRRPKLPPRPPRKRGRRPPKPKPKYGPPNVNYAPISHYTPQNLDETFSTSYETSYSDHSTFGEPPYNPISNKFPSSTFGIQSPSQFGTSSSSFSQHNIPSSSYGKPQSFEGLSSPTFQSFDGLKEGYNPGFTEFNSPINQFPLDNNQHKDLYKTSISSYDVPLNYNTQPSLKSQQNLFEPSSNYGDTYRGSGSSHSPTNRGDGSNNYFPSLPNNYKQEQFHSFNPKHPSKVTSASSIPSSEGFDNSYNQQSSYDGVSESQKVQVKAKIKSTPTVNDFPVYSSLDNFDLEDLYPAAQTTSTKRPKSRRRKKPKNPTSTAHNLDTDDLRDAFGSSSDFHQIAISPDEFLDFEPKKFIKHSKPTGVTFSRNDFPANFVLLASANKQKENKPPNYRTPNHSNHKKNLSAPPTLDYKSIGINNYFNFNDESKEQEDIDIISIQKSKSKSYYAGTVKEPVMLNGFQPTRRLFKSNSEYEDEDDYRGRINNARSKKNTEEDESDYSNESADEEVPKNHKI